jgi:hypothetical protein
MDDLCFLRFLKAGKEEKKRSAARRASRECSLGAGESMYPKILTFLIPAALLFAALICILLWDRIQRDRAVSEAGNGKPEGAFRAFHHLLWVLILWSGMALSFPLWVSYKQQIGVLPMDERWIFLAKILAFPIILLLLLQYGARRGYLRWIFSPDWPDKENRE